MNGYFGPALVAGCLLMLGACSDQGEVVQGELSPFAAQYLNLRNGGQESALRQQNQAVNRSFSNLQGAYRESSGSEPGDSGDGDSTVWVDPWMWETCAEITETKNDDGSITVTYDYGEGCEEGWGDYKYIMYGRYSTTSRYTNVWEGSKARDSYYFKTLYEDYGGRNYYDSSEWSLDGNSEYAGESYYDTTDFSFGGWYEWNDRTSYAYNKEQYTYTSNGQNRYSNKGSVTERAEYEYTTGPDYYYKSTVLEPLVSDYTCNTVFYRAVEEGDDDRISLWVYSYVSGVEKVDYRSDGKSGSFVIDYGDGECDNIIYVTENGVTVRVDLGDQGPIPFAAGR
jgi:hypothetical protein